jgi:hypothetical protein
VPSENVQLVADLFGGLLIPDSDAEVDLIKMLSHTALLEAHERMIDPAAPIEFETPYGGLLGGMGGPFFGASGFLKAWQEWLVPWESFSIRMDEFKEVESNVLAFVHCVGRVSQSGLEVDTPAAAIYTVESGRIVKIRHFLDQDQARAAVGLTA